MAMRVTLDANILVYAIQRDDPKHATAVTIVARAVRADCVQTLQSLAECLHVLIRKRIVEPATAVAEVAGFRRHFRLAAAQADDLDEAAAAVLEHRLSFWDALLWATARRAGCRLILTEDQQDGRNLGGVRFVNPFRPGNAPILDLALPPMEAMP
jgi:predicted nucleic acid-binding protein